MMCCSVLNTLTVFEDSQIAAFARRTSERKFDATLLSDSRRVCRQPSAVGRSIQKGQHRQRPPGRQRSRAPFAPRDPLERPAASGPGGTRVPDAHCQYVSESARLGLSVVYICRVNSRHIMYISIYSCNCVFIILVNCDVRKKKQTIERSLMGSVARAVPSVPIRSVMFRVLNLQSIRFIHCSGARPAGTPLSSAVLPIPMQCRRQSSAVLKHLISATRSCGSV